MFACVLMCVLFEKKKQMHVNVCVSVCVHACFCVHSVRQRVGQNAERAACRVRAHLCQPSLRKSKVTDVF